MNEEAEPRSGSQEEDPTGPFGRFLEDFDRYENFAFSKINHGFWEALGDVKSELGWPVAQADHARADQIAQRNSFFMGGFVDELLLLLKEAVESDDPALQLHWGLSAWPDDNRIIGTPFRPEISQEMLHRITSRRPPGGDGLVLKRAIHDGSFTRFLDRLRQFHVIVVGPEFLGSFFSFAGVSEGEHIAIHPSRARDDRATVEEGIEAAIRRADSNTVVLLQAGTLAPYWILRLRNRNPRTRWVDAGLALSICHMPDLLGRPWGKAYRRELVRFHNRCVGHNAYSEKALEPIVSESLARQETARKPAGRIAFIEKKSPDMDRVGQLLKVCSDQNAWANRGPLFRALGEAYTRFMNLPGDLVAMPCSNGGMALEALARHLELEAGKRLRWVASAFSFANVSRGIFSSARFLDCDETGMLSLEQLEALPPDSYDGFVVTNIFGMCSDVSAYIRFARASQKVMLIDNAAGMGPRVPGWPYQAFSLHQTKPFGTGEGGLFVAPSEEASKIYALLEYGLLPGSSRSAWLNNGKISDLSCAFHLDRLERYPEWGPFYQMQGRRIFHIARSVGLKPLIPFDEKTAIANSQPYVADQPILLDRIWANPLIVLGKYYKPLEHLPKTVDIYKRIVNIPCHPDVASIETEDLRKSLGMLLTET